MRARPDAVEGAPATTNVDELSPEERDVALQVVEMLRDIRFGTVMLVVQDGVVVQIEMAEKFRLR